MASVLVADRAAFFTGDWPQGFLPLDGVEAMTFLRAARDRSRFVDRALAERTPAWKQWIPYCVLRCIDGGPGGAGDPARIAGVFCVQRTSGQGETRLHGAWSIGLGGHVEPDDAAAAGDGPAFFAQALQRELGEELAMEAPPRPPRMVGLVNDDSTPVGSVHAGLVYVWDLIGPVEVLRSAVGVREVAKMRGGLTSLAEFRGLWQDPAKFESWSQFLVRGGLAGPLAPA